MSDDFDLIARRESCRNFDPARPVTKEQMEKCVDAARLAPSACNGQPWQYLAVLSEENCKALRPCLQALGMNRFANNCPAFAVVLQNGRKRAGLVRGAGLVKQQDLRPIDIGLSVSQFCYAATEQGLSTCILGWLNEEKIKALFNLGASYEVRLVLAVGYAADETLRKKSRRPLEDVVRFY